jgi:hypothetical protein
MRLRDGESNLLAGLLREDERRVLQGFPGLIRMPVLRQLFAANDASIRQTDVVMLLTPRIVRSHELTAADLAPVFIGTQGNMALGGPPPLIANPAGEPDAAPLVIGGKPTPTPPVTPIIPPGSSPIPGTMMPPPTPPVTVPAAPPPAATVPAQPPGAVVSPPVPTEPIPPPVQPAPPVQPGPPPAAKPAPTDPSPAPAGGGGRVSLSPPPQMSVGAGPYTVPVSISGASRLTTVSVTITYNPAILRVRNVQEGPFMRQGGIAASFVQQGDPAAGRVDIVVTRPGDQVGATGTGLLAAILFEPVAAGSATLSVTGTGQVIGGGAAVMTFSPATVVVK